MLHFATNNGGSIRLKQDKLNWRVYLHSIPRARVCMCIRKNESIRLTRWVKTWIFEMINSRVVPNEHLHSAVIVAKDSTMAVICFISHWILVSRFQRAVQILMDGSTRVCVCVCFSVIVILVSDKTYKNNSVKTQLTLFIDFNVILVFVIPQAITTEIAVFTDKKPIHWWFTKTTEKKHIFPARLEQPNSQWITTLGWCLKSHCLTKFVVVSVPIE